MPTAKTNLKICPFLLVRAVTTGQEIRATVQLTDLVCVVVVPRPSLLELERMDGCVAYAHHDCQDFKAEEEIRNALD